MRKETFSFSYYEILDACKESGCPLCRLGQTSANRHLRGVIFDSVNNPTLREKLRASMGYCHDHAWLLPEAGESATLGIAIIHRDLLNTLRRRLEKSSYGKGRRPSLRSVMAGAINRGAGGSKEAAESNYLPASAQCPACEHRDKAEELALKSLAFALKEQDEPMIGALSQSEGLCLPHLRLAMGTARSEQAFDTLVSITQEQLTAHITHLDEFVRKSDHRFRDEKISEDERRSWRLALERVDGPRTKI